MRSSFAETVAFIRSTFAEPEGMIILQVMRAYLPNFVHEEKGKNLDQKM